MSSTVGKAFGLLLVLMFSIFIPDVTIHGVKYLKVEQASKSITELIEQEGIINSNTQSEINNILTKKGLDPDEWNIIISRTGKINYNERFEVILEGQHRYQSINIMGTELGNFSVPISQTEPGYSKVYFR